MSGRREPDAATALGRALLRDAGGAGCAVEVVGASARAWASATFVGERVALALRLDGKADAWIASLAEAELAAAGWLVADLTVDSTPGGAVVAALMLREA